MQTPGVQRRLIYAVEDRSPGRPPEARNEGVVRVQDHPSTGLAELGYETVSDSPFGIGGPAGMNPTVVKTLHDAFRKAIDDPKHVELMEQLNQDVWYRSGDDYTKWARDTFVRDKALIERLGLAAK